ncbi:MULTISPECIES: hypothetical protein [Microbispora]|uniref:Lipoprotein n=1 Tax=Microbispora hainanensis TaxID=568844 RepID=A0ABZ1SVE4_9ACTN|nr:MULTISPECIES: hypothetical protein [Microbispora]
MTGDRFVRGARFGGHSGRPVIAASLLVALTGCGPGGSVTAAQAPSPPTASAAAASSSPVASPTVSVAVTPTAERAKGSLFGVYQGMAEIALTSYDYCKARFDRHANGRKRYTMPATLIISAPKGQGTTRDGNPFSFDIQIGKLGTAGSLWLISAVEFAPSKPGRSARVLTYWRITYADGTLSGRLVDTHQDEKKEINDFTGENPLVPCRPELGMINMLYAIAKGATMEGKLGNGKADLRIKASTRNGLFAFSLRLTV